MNILTTEKTPTATMNEVVMKKSELLEKLRENKEKHDTLFDLAVSGYWELAKEKLEEKKTRISC